jgi:HTH-type transcriptional regulator/antitoxin HigA
MPDNNNSDHLNINDLLNDLLKPSSLKDLFEQKLRELDLAPTAALGILGMQHRALYGILEGTQKIVDFTNLIKLSSFLQVPREEILRLYVDSLQRNFPSLTVSNPEKVKFIKENFDLAALKKAGMIDSITDFAHIEERILARLGLRSIFEYRPPDLSVAFSSGHFQPKNALTRSFWIKAATSLLEEISNPYEFDRKALVDFFPQLRWYSTKVEHGLAEVVRILFRIGVTVIYQPPMQGLQLRGATFAVNDKPCIVLTNLQGFYPTLWFALVHELYHILFDWQDILENRYHLTDDDDQELTVREREEMADNFAREYFVSTEKLKSVRRYLNDPSYIEEFALHNNVHPSFLYVFSAWDASKTSRSHWGRARKYNPDYRLAIEQLDLPWSESRQIHDVIKERRNVTYK